MISAKILLVLAALPFLTVAARADKIHFLSRADKTKFVGNAPDFIEGKIMSEDADKIELRVQGGTMIIARKQISWIEKDAGLKVADIVAREKAAAVQLRSADSDRLQRQGAWADAVAKKRQEMESAPTTKELRIIVDFKGILPSRVLRFYDPILHRVRTVGIAQVVERYLMEEIQRLQLTKRGR